MEPRLWWISTLTVDPWAGETAQSLKSRLTTKSVRVVSPLHCINHHMAFPFLNVLDELSKNALFYPTQYFCFLLK